MLRKILDYIQISAIFIGSIIYAFLPLIIGVLAIAGIVWFADYIRVK